MPKLPRELDDLLERYAPEDLDLRLKHLVDTEHGLQVDLAVTAESYGNEPESQYWRITLSGLLKTSIDWQTGSFMQLTTDDPILWEYQHRNASLYFRGACENPGAIVVALLNLHNSLFGAAVPFGRYFRMHSSATWLLEQRHGLLAEGPEILLKQIASVLEKSGLTCSIVPPAPHLLESRVDGPFLLDIGESYFVASGISFERLQSSDTLQSLPGKGL